MDDRASEKKDRLLAALERGMVMVHLDARRPGVIVPTELRCESHLRLHLSYRFDPFDLSVGEWGMRSTQDDPKSNSWGGQNVFDVYSKTTEKAPDGTAYAEW